MKNNSTTGQMSFERVGDSWQIAVRTADDLSHVKDLDAAVGNDQPADRLHFLRPRISRVHG